MHNHPFVVGKLTDGRQQDAQYLIKEIRLANEVAEARQPRSPSLSQGHPSLGQWLRQGVQRLTSLFAGQSTVHWTGQ